MRTTCFQFSGLGIFVLVDHVFIDAFIHQLVNFVIHPGLAKGRQVLPGITIHH